MSDKAVAELRDSIFSLLCMANEMNVDVEEVPEERPGQVCEEVARRWKRPFGEGRVVTSS